MSLSNILVPYSGNLGDETLLETATEVAVRTNARLTLVDVLQRDTANCYVVERRKRLERLAESIRFRGIDVSADTLCGPRNQVLVRQVLRHGYDLVMVADDRAWRGRATALISSCADLTHKCPCPVWSIKPEARISPSRAAALLSARPEHLDLDREVLRLGAELSERLGCKLLLISAWEVSKEDRDKLNSGVDADLRAHVEVEYSQFRAEALTDLLNDLGIDPSGVEFALPHGTDPHVITAAVQDRDADLAIVGSSVKGMLGNLLFSSTADLVAPALPCSVLTVKPADFVSPLAPTEY